MRLLFASLALCLAGYTAQAYNSVLARVHAVNDDVIAGNALPRKLSDFGFFTDKSGWQPNERVLPYQLNSPLFSDYADKYRFIYLPDGKKLRHDTLSSDGLLQFPVGAAIIKSFGYRIDGKDRLLETRVMLHRADGWLALPYVWNTEQTEAVLKVAGTRIAVTFTDPSGETQSISYAMPNKNQCKECHALDNVIMPIGPKLRNIDADSMKHLIAAGLMDAPQYDVQKMPNYASIERDLESRARAYLDINCAHCHNRQGSASNSGLFLGYEEPHGVSMGINKRPVAAGRGSGGHEFAIKPGHPDESIMLYRLNSLDPGVAMPEVGRGTVHKEGAELLSAWIAQMEQ